MTPRRWLLIAIAAAALGLLAGRALAQMFVDYEWYVSMGAADVWRARLGASVAIRAVSGIAAALFVFANLYAVRYSVVSLVLPRRLANLEIGEEVPGRYLMAGVVAASVVFGALLTLPQDDWSAFLLARAGTPFGEYDPYFSADLGFFVYWLPFESAVYYWTLVSILIVTALVVFLYALTPSLRWERGAIYISAYVRRHLTVLAGVLMAMLAWSYRLDMYSLLSGGSGVDGAFTYADHMIGIPGSLVLALVTLGAAVIVMWSGWTGQIRLALGAITGVLALSVAVRQVAPFAARRWADERDPAARERPYEATRAGYTRRAFAVGRIASADSLVAYRSLGDAGRVVSEWDTQAILRALDRTRPADLAAAGIGWRGSDAGLVAEIPEHQRAADTASPSWILTRVLVSASDEHGGLLRVNDSGVSTLDETTLDRPLVFEGAAGWVVVADSAGRIIGAPLEGTVARLAHAWSLQKPALLFGDLVHPHPTVVSHRDVRARIRSLAPFFTQATLVVPVVVGDTLYWTVDLYSSSSTYPLSRRILLAGDQRTYFQHAATAIVRATTGEVLFVADSALDPVAMTWVRRFPSLFTRQAALLPALVAALPPAADGVLAQAVAFGRYGTRADSDVPRHIPDLSGADSALVGSDPPFGLPGSQATATAIPLLDSQSERVRGLVIGVGGPNRRTIWYALSQTGPRWPTVIDRLRSDDTVAANREAPLVRGNVRAIPIAGDVVYVQSSYVWRSTGAPTLARIALLARDSVRSAPSFAQSAGSLPTGAAVRAAPAPPDFRARVDSLYRVMRDALHRGDWTAFGRAFDALGRVTAGSNR